jgi:hypothetical protein
MMRYLFVLFLFVLGMLMLGGQHTHESYEVYGVAKDSHSHYEYADSSHNHDGDYAQCSFTGVSCSFSRRGDLHSH